MQNFKYKKPYYCCGSDTRIRNWLSRNLPLSRKSNLSSRGQITQLTKQTVLIQGWHSIHSVITTSDEDKNGIDFLWQSLLWQESQDKERTLRIWLLIWAKILSILSVTRIIPLGIFAHLIDVWINQVNELQPVPLMSLAVWSTCSYTNYRILQR